MLPLLPEGRFDVIVSQQRHAFAVTVLSELEANVIADEQRALGRIVQIIEILTDTVETATAALDDFFKGAK